MPSRSQYNRRGSDGDEDEIVAVSSDSEESESEANRGAEADDDDEYVGESSDAGGGDEAEEAGRSDCGEGGDLDGDDHVATAGGHFGACVAARRLPIRRGNRRTWMLLSGTP